MKLVLGRGFVAIKYAVAACALLASTAMGVVAYAAAEDVAVDPAVSQVIITQLQKGRPDLQFGAVQASPLPGIYQVDVAQGPTLYVTQDGSHFIAGDLFRIAPEGFVNVREQQREAIRVARLAEVPRAQQIVFPAVGTTKAFVTVFTDVDCGYCVKLHREVPRLNELGIEVRYMAYPRAGLESTSYDKIATAWCSKNPSEALTRMKNSEQVEIAVCKNNPVAAQFTLGNELGVRGTPALITEQGVLLPGYMPADQLAATLGVN